MKDPQTGEKLVPLWEERPGVEFLQLRNWREHSEFGERGEYRLLCWPWAVGGSIFPTPLKRLTNEALAVAIGWLTYDPDREDPLLEALRNGVAHELDTDARRAGIRERGAFGCRPW